MVLRDGFILPVDKPAGPSSHDVVSTARRALNEGRVGHCGTLDPFASGLLILCVGRATRLAEYLSATEKSYLASARLGIETESHDPEGRVTARSEAWRELSRERIELAFSEFSGTIEQVPPRFSAKKVEGERAYRAARRGERAELDAVRVEIRGIEVEKWDPPTLTFSVHCSAGTYVRALARDLGRNLGVHAHLATLRRTRSGVIGEDDAIACELLDDPSAVAEARISPLGALGHLPRLAATEIEAIELGFGRSIEVSASELDERVGGGESAVGDPGFVRISRPSGLFAVAESRLVAPKLWLLRPRKVFPA